MSIAKINNNLQELNQNELSNQDVPKINSKNNRQICEGIRLDSICSSAVTSCNIEKLIISKEEKAKYVIRDFTEALIVEINKLIKEEGKEELLKLLEIK